MCSNTRTVGLDPENLASFTGSTGDYYLLAIAIDKYDEAEVTHKFKPLNNAVYDAASVVEILLKKYNFYTPTETETEALNGETTYSGKPIYSYNSLKTKCLYNQNATFDNIVMHLDKLCNSMGEHDNLLIYFAGHGVTRSNQNAYIIPFDAINQPLKYRTWFPLADFADTFDNYLTNKIAQRLLLIVDACYSGGAVLGRQGNNSPEYFSRYVLTSTSAEQVADDGAAGEGSPFAQAFLHFLDENTKPFIAINKGKITDSLERITMGNSEQEITHLPLPSNQNGSGNFIFELKEKEKPDLKKLARSLVTHLNFDYQKTDLKRHFVRGKSDNLILLSTLGYSHDAQKFCARVLFHHLKYLQCLFPNDFFVVNRELKFMADISIDQLWIKLCESVDLAADTVNARAVFMDWLCPQLQRDSLQRECRPLVLWLGYETGSEELTKNLMQLWREFTDLFQTRMHALNVDEYFDKLFFVLADEREGDLFLKQRDFVKTIGSYPKIVITDQIEQLTKYEMTEWLIETRKQIKTAIIEELQEDTFFDEIEQYKLLPFIRKLGAHCGFERKEKYELESLLLDFRKPLL